MTSAFINAGLCGFAGTPIGWVSPTAPVAGPVFLFGEGVRNLISGVPNSADIICEDLLVAQKPAQNLPDVFIPEGESGVISEMELTAGSTAAALRRSAKPFGELAAAPFISSRPLTGGVNDLPPQEELERMAQEILRDPIEIVQKIPNERVRIAVAKICAAQDGWGTAVCFENFSITDPSAIIEIAKICAANDGWRTAEYFKNFGITNPSTIIEIAKICAAQNGWGTALYFKNFGIIDPSAIIAIAKICAAQNGWGTAQCFKNFGITDLSAIIAIAKICAEQNGWVTAMYFKNFGITDLSAIIEIAKICAAQDGGGTAEYFKNFGIIDRTTKLEIAKIALMENASRDVLQKMVKNFDLQLPLVEFSDEYGRDDITAWAREALGMRGLDEGLADCLYADMRRRDTGLVLFFELLYQAETNRDTLPGAAKAGPAALSRYLLSNLVGMDSGLLQGRKFSERAIGDFYEMAIALNLGLDSKALSQFKFSPELFGDRSLRDMLGFLHLLGRLKGILGKDVRVYWPVLPTLFERVASGEEVSVSGLADLESIRVHDSGSVPLASITPNNIGRITKWLNDTFLNLFSEAFKIEGAKVTMEDIEKLEGKWGNLDVFYTLIARFAGSGRWRDEIPVLGRVAKTVLTGKFGEYKYRGFEGDEEDVKKAAAQLAMLQGDDAVEGWMHNYSRIGVFHSTSDVAGKTPEELLAQSKAVLIGQVMGHVEEELSGREIEDDEVATIKAAVMANPKTETVLKYKKNRTALIRALFELLRGAPTLPEYEKILGLIRANSGAMGLSRQLVEDVKTLGDSLKYKDRTSDAIVFTTTTDDPALLLKTGDLVDTSSCQNYRTGSHIETLLGYVIDANVKLMLSYVLQEKDFASRTEYERAMELVTFGATPVFVAAKQILKVGDIEVKLPKAYRRRVIKLGSTSDGRAGIAMERAHFQNHPADGLIDTQISDAYRELARASAAVTDEEITIPESRNPGGVYSDASGGIMRGSYKIKTGD